MNEQEFINKVEECFTDEVTITTNDGEYTIQDGSYFVGGEEGTFMSELLGNVYYDSLEDIAMSMYSYITNDLKEEIEDVS